MDSVQAQEQVGQPTADRRPAEFELLLACCHPENAPELMQDFRGVVDWNGFLRLAHEHGLLPIVHQTLGRNASRIPNWREFERAAALNSLRTGFLNDLLQQVLERLQAHGVEALPYKGPMLAEMVHGKVALRQYTDLDVLIRPADLTRARAALTEIGLAPHIQLTAAQEKAYLASGYELTFDGFGNKNLVELQWGILPRFYAVDFDMDRIFERAQSARVSGRETRSLAPDDLFVVLSVHAAKHLWARLAWIYDIARLSSVASINWNEVEKTAKELGVLRTTGVTLRLCHELFGVHVPDVLQHAAEDKKAVGITHEIVARLQKAEQPDTESAGYFRQWRRLRERPSDRGRFLFRLASTPSVGEWDAVRLPGPLFPLYRVVRMFRLARRFVTRPG